MPALSVFPGHPFSLDPPERIGKRLLQKRDVLSDQEQTERQHPEAEDGQNTEDAAEDEKQREGNPHQPRRWLPQPAYESAAFLRKPVRNPLEVAVEFSPGFCTHFKTAGSVRDCDTALDPDSVIYARHRPQGGARQGKTGKWLNLLAPRGRRRYEL